MNFSVARSDSGKIPTRVIVIQLAFLVFLAGVFAYVKIYAPRMEKEGAAARVAMRESRIQDFFNRWGKWSRRSARPTPAPQTLPEVST